MSQEPKIENSAELTSAQIRTCRTQSLLVAFLIVGFTVGLSYAGYIGYTTYLAMKAAGTL